MLCHVQPLSRLMTMTSAAVPCVIVRVTDVGVAALGISTYPRIDAPSTVDTAGVPVTIVVFDVPVMLTGARDANAVAFVAITPHSIVFVGALPNVTPKLSATCVACE